MEKEIEIIKESLIHENIKFDLTFYDGEFEWETDFMFGFIAALQHELNLEELENDDYEWKCYEWCNKYFGKYLNITSDIITEGGYILYTKDIERRNLIIENYKRLNKSGKPLNLSIDHNIINNIKGKLYFTN